MAMPSGCSMILIVLMLHIVFEPGAMILFTTLEVKQQAGDESIYIYIYLHHIYIKIPQTARGPESPVTCHNKNMHLVSLDAQLLPHSLLLPPVSM